MTNVLQPTKQLQFLQSITPTPEQLLSVVGLEGRIPVDPLDVANRLDINCIGTPSKAIAEALGDTDVLVEGVSFLREADGSYWVFYGSDRHENAQRFTVAHELAHIILHKDALPLNRQRTARRALESAANRFAAGLLMPATLLRRYLDVPADVVAKTFRVSPRAAEIRLANI